VSHSLEPAPLSKKLDIACKSEVRVAGIEAFAECLQALVHSDGHLYSRNRGSLMPYHRGVNGRHSAPLVRRDVLANKSRTLPWKNIASNGKFKSGFVIRMPVDEGGEDLLTTMQNVWELVEGHSSITASNGTRLPAFVTGEYRLAQRNRTVQTKEESLANSRISTHLWADEKWEWNEIATCRDGFSAGRQSSRDPCTERLASEREWNSLGESSMIFTSQLYIIHFHFCFPWD
jgi:hypothetical protein